MDNDWFDDQEEGTSTNTSEANDVQRRLRNLGENEGLEEGMRRGELHGFQQGYKEEAMKAFPLGQAIGAARVAVNITKNKKIQTALAELEEAASKFWISDPSRVQTTLETLRIELKELGIILS